MKKISLFAVALMGVIGASFGAAELREYVSMWLRLDRL